MARTWPADAQLARHHTRHTRQSLATRRSARTSSSLTMFASMLLKQGSLVASSSARLLTQRSVQQGARAMSTAPAKLGDLPYAYGALEPTISATIMEIHHSKHHNTYVTNFNVALEKYAAAEDKGDVAAMIALQSALKFNGGGHVNHTLFWENLAPASSGGGGEPTGDLAAAINGKWGSFDAFKADMNATTAAVQGSGWGWLAYDPKAKDVCIVTCANQDPCSTTGLIPLLGIDIWEHAYYLDYKNVRPDYLTAIWDVVNFDVVSKRLAAAKA